MAEDRHLSRRAFVALAAVRPGAPRITRIRHVPIQGRFHKFVAMNSYDTAPKGHTYTNTLVRIETDQGVEGVGVASGAVKPEMLRPLLGADPLSLYEQGVTPYGLDGPLYDLAGKLKAKPAWRLLGDSVRERLEVYDGTLYFSDVWFRDRGVRAVVEEAEEAVKSGYLGMKFKLGRGWKWMEKEAGLQRDIEVLKAVRRAVGPRIKILADANNGYRDDFERAWRLMEATAGVKLYWMEEIFPEDVEGYTRLRERMEKAGIKTFIADGENVREPRAFAPYLRPRRLIDVLQMDIRVGGFRGNMEMARLGQEAGAVSVPHNWASQVGLYMGLHLGKAVQSVTAAEDDRSTCDVLAADGYTFRGGHYTVSNAPGLGLRIDEAVYRDKYAAQETVVA